MADTLPIVLHSRPAHQVLGWCGRCPDRDLEEEAKAWRDHALAVYAAHPANALREVGRCYCQPAGQFIAVPEAGTYLVQDGRMQAVGVSAPQGPPFDQLLAEVVRSVYGKAARVLADAPPGAQAEITLMTDTPDGPVAFCRYQFTRTPEEAPHG